jgi:hypothetical protein
MNRILGILWMLFCGLTGILSLGLLLYHGIFFTHLMPYFFPKVLISMLYVAGGIAGFFLFRNSQLARKLILFIAGMIILVTLVMFIACKSLPEVYYIISLFSIVSIVILFLSRDNPIS